MEYRSRTPMPWWLPLTCRQRPNSREKVTNNRYLNPHQFIDAIAPTEEGFSRIKRDQYSLRA